MVGNLILHSQCRNHGIEVADCKLAEYRQSVEEELTAGLPLGKRLVAERPSLLWLFVELPLATAIAFLPAIWTGDFAQRAATQGLVLATLLVLIPSEFLRHFVGPARLGMALKNLVFDSSSSLARELHGVRTELLQAQQTIVATLETHLRDIDAIRSEAGLAQQTLLVELAGLRSELAAKNMETKQTEAGQDEKTEQELAQLQRRVLLYQEEAVKFAQQLSHLTKLSAATTAARAVLVDEVLTDAGVGPDQAQRIVRELAKVGVLAGRLEATLPLSWNVEAGVAYARPPLTAVVLNVREALDEQKGVLSFIAKSIQPDSRTSPQAVFGLVLSVTTVLDALTRQINEALEAELRMPSVVPRTQQPRDR